jgi:hypothetical protein
MDNLLIDEIHVSIFIPKQFLRLIRPSFTKRLRARFRSRPQ